MEEARELRNKLLRRRGFQYSQSARPREPLAIDRDNSILVPVSEQPVRCGQSVWEELNEAQHAGFADALAVDEMMSLWHRCLSHHVRPVGGPRRGPSVSLSDVGWRRATRQVTTRDIGHGAAMSMFGGA